jgi:hypothetical protein
MDIKVGITGEIVNSSHSGHRVRVVDDTENTGGFLIFEWWPGSGGPNEDEAFDNWVVDRSALERYFHESAWQVHWHTAT